MTQKIDNDKLKTYAKDVFGALGGAMTSAMIYLGDRMGFYKVLADEGALTSEELATKTDLDERWVREWIQQQGASGVLEYQGDGRFALSAEGVAVLANEMHPAFGAGFFAQLPQMLQVAEKLPEAFKTGRGLPYDAFGPEGAAGIERGFAPWFRTLLVPLALPKIPGVVEALDAGVDVADIGCGTGVAVLEMAKAYPNSKFVGYDISSYALDRANENLKEAGVSNARFTNAAEEPIPDDGRYGFITTFDCLHDMTDPAGIIRQIRKALRDDGTWFVADIKARPTYEENVAKNPMASMMYGTSVIACMSSALSEPGGAGLGTLGLHSELLQDMVEQAGFGSFDAIDLGHPVNAFYIVRPYAELRPTLLVGPACE